MNLDIRVPIGILFLALGAVLAGYGLVSDKAIYAKSLGVNVNLWWGLVMLGFGAVMFAFGRRAPAGPAVASEAPAAEGAPRSHH